MKNKPLLVVALIAWAAWGVGAMSVGVLIGDKPEPAPLCREGETVVYNLRQHKEPLHVNWQADDEEQHNGVVPIVWCDSTGIPTSFTQEELDAYGISLEKS